MNAAPVAQAEANEAGRPGPTPDAEVLMTGTDGARVLPFRVLENTGSVSACTPRSASACSQASESTFTRSCTPAVKPLVKGLLGISDSRVWKPKLYSRNPDFPQVSTPGCFFVQHSGGFQLIHRATLKYLGHYTKSSIALLEEKYGKKKRRAKNR
jgi:hypothetical protein